ncbi:hypothetical protein CNR22_09170 [Sphingobacteriaceae bacterium]|nr:hypothetical protein CNR22_09170 [Sphingobacteriaceae bacterium]
MKSIILCVLLIFLSLRIFCQTTFSCTASGTLCPCSSGATGEYYSGYFNDVHTYFTATTVGLTRNESTIGYSTDNWGSIAPPASGSNASPETYSTRFSGRIFVAAGSYTFYLTSDDACYLFLGGNALIANPTSGNSFINNGGLHSPTTVSAVAIFTANCLQDFKIHYGENTGNNRCVLEYQSAGLSITRQVVPNGAMCACMSSSPLPIQLLKFYALLRDGSVNLNWSTASEMNNDYFTLFKSKDGLSWYELAQISGSGTSNRLVNYSVDDPESSTGLNYYYLRQTDKDGTSTNYDIITFDVSNRNNIVKIYPNPFQNKLTVLSSEPLSVPADIRIYDAFGSLINLPVFKTDKYALEIITDDLVAGTYFIKIKTSSGFIAKRLLKN